MLQMKLANMREHYEGLLKGLEKDNDMLRRRVEELECENKKKDEDMKFRCALMNVLRERCRDRDSLKEENFSLKIRVKVLDDQAKHHEQTFTRLDYYLDEND